MDTYCVTALYSKKNLKTATDRYFLKVVGKPVLIGLCALFVYCLAVFYFSEPGWLFPGFIVFNCAMILILCFFVQSQMKYMKLLKQLKNPEVRFEFDEYGVSQISDLASSTLSWNGIHRLWQFKDVWLLFFTKEIYATLPLESLPTEVQTFIVDQLKENDIEIDSGSI